MKVRGREHECPHDREKTVSRQSHSCVRHGGADQEQDHANRARNHDIGAAVMAKSEAESDNAEGHNDDQHLGMQVSFGEVREKWQAGYEKRQGKAMDQAKCRQSNRCAIEPAGRFRHILIHSELPLS